MHCVVERDINRYQADYDSQVEMNDAIRERTEQYLEYPVRFLFEHFPPDEINSLQEMIDTLAFSEIMKEALKYKEDY